MHMHNIEAIRRDDPLLSAVIAFQLRRTDPEMLLQSLNSDFALSILLHSPREMDAGVDTNCKRP